LELKWPINGNISDKIPFAQDSSKIPMIGHFNSNSMQICRLFCKTAI